MRKFFLFILLVVLTIDISFAQKPIITLDVVLKDTWESAVSPAICNNGNFVKYVKSDKGKDTLVIKSVKGSWIRKFPNVKDCFFTDDSRSAIFIKDTDSLCILALGRNEITCKLQVTSFQLFTKEKKQCLAYQIKNSGNDLLIQELNTGNTHRFKNINNYLISPDGKKIILSRHSKNNMVILKWVDLITMYQNDFWEGSDPLNMFFDKGSMKLAFITDGGSEIEGKSIWCFNQATETILKLIDNATTGLGNNLRLENISKFSIDGQRIFLTLKEKTYLVPKADAAKVDVWSYTDEKLQSQQLVEDVSVNSMFYKGPKDYAAIIDLKSCHILQLQYQSDEIEQITNGNNDDWMMVVNRKGEKNESSWNKKSKPSYFLVSTKTAYREEMKLPYYDLSPSGKLLISTDDLGNFFSYDLKTGSVIDISRTIPVGAGDARDDTPAKKDNRGLTFWGQWLVNEEMLLIYDRYDIWLVDPYGVKPPVNLTNGFGRRNLMVFRFIGSNERIRFHRNERIVLSAFDLNNKNNGFYSLVLGKKADPMKLTMGAYIYCGAGYGYPEQDINGEKPLKSLDAESYLITRSSATESPNFFWTKDFKSFKPLSTVVPEKKFNWLTSELKLFKTLDGGYGQGILYKPENFDPKKRYPVIVYYYEHKSERLNQYYRPDLMADANINLPLLVSQGYLVFIPDIHYKVGRIGESALNSIVAAGKYLADLNYVNASKIGLSGHSFGGFETNYVITHSKFFAAAFAGSATSNQINRVGSYDLNTGRGLSDYLKLQQSRMGSDLWERPDVYIDNSPVFNADKVTTPVLLMNNKNDAIVHFDQGTQFFMALRRLNKKAWMLQYDGESHNLYQSINKKDLTTRVLQFFDHYLKRAPAPIWMTRGIAAKDKGIKDGLELDTMIKTPGPGLLTPEEQRKIDGYSKIPLGEKLKPLIQNKN
nr:prolyl oligopeptidase family serine peptidase [Pedobacter panaciterrae]